MKIALNTDEVVSFFKAFILPVQYSSFDCNTGWHKRLVENFMMKHNLKFANKEHYKENSLRMLCTQEKNTAFKNKNWQMKDYTGMFINLTKPKDKNTGKGRDKGLWNCYFIKWVGQNKGVTLENSWNTARDGKLNIDSSTKKKIYNEESIKVIREKCGNNGWDRLLICVDKERKESTKDWETMMNTFLI
eukprot:10328084-Ditylum_brightwellii.AAC.1